MSRMTSQYPERVYSSSEEGRQRSAAEWRRPGKISPGWLLAGLAGIGIAAWMVYHFGPDFVRYVKMERM